MLLLRRTFAGHATGQCTKRLVTSITPSRVSVTEYLSVKGGKLLSLGSNKFHADWLRHNCQCHRCRDSLAGRRNVDASDLKDLAITSALMKGEHVHAQSRY